MPKPLDTELVANMLSDYLDGMKVASIAEKYSVGEATIFRLIKRDKWNAKRLHFKQKVQTKVAEKKITKVVNDTVTWDSKMLGDAEDLRKAFLSTLREMLKEFDAIPPTQLRELTVAALNIQKMGKLALGEAADIQRIDGTVTVPDSFREIVKQLDEYNGSRAGKHTPVLQ